MMVRIRRNSGGGLVLEREGEEPRAVKPVRALPITEPHAWIGLLDAKGKPLHMIRSLKELDPDSQALLEAELERLYFLPKIERLDAISEEYGVLRLEVITDKGPHSFEIRSREHIRFLPGGRILLRDLDGNRYEIPCVDRLDARGRMLAEVFL